MRRLAGVLWFVVDHVTEPAEGAASLDRREQTSAQPRFLLFGEQLGRSHPLGARVDPVAWLDPIGEFGDVVEQRPGDDLPVVEIPEAAHPGTRVLVEDVSQLIQLSGHGGPAAVLARYPITQQFREFVAPTPPPLRQAPTSAHN